MLFFMQRKILKTHPFHSKKTLEKKLCTTSCLNKLLSYPRFCLEKLKGLRGDIKLCTKKRLDGISRDIFPQFFCKKDSLRGK